MRRNDDTKHVTSTTETKLTPLWHGPAAGAASSIAARVLTYPADTIKAQQQLQGARHGASTLKAFQQVGKAEGLAGFYRGFGAVLSGVVPATALYFGGYESGKRMLPPDCGMLGDMLVGCYTQAIAGIVFTPVDVIKERMQVRCKHSCSKLTATAALSMP